MKVNVIFKLPEEQDEYQTAMDGGKYKAALQELDNFLRGKIKYTDEETIKLEDIRAKLHEFVNDAGASIWD
jgi:hypothetical protein